MSDIASDVRSSLRIRRLGALMFAKMLGPKDCSAFHAEWYVSKWLASGRRSADDTDSRKRQTKDAADYTHLHSIFRCINPNYCFQFRLKSAGTRLWIMNVNRNFWCCQGWPNSTDCSRSCETLELFSSCNVWQRITAGDFVLWFKSVRLGNCLSGILM